MIVMMRGYLVREEVLIPYHPARIISSEENIFIIVSNNEAHHASRIPDKSIMTPLAHLTSFSPTWSRSCPEYHY